MQPCTLLVQDFLLLLSANRLFCDLLRKQERTPDHFTSEEPGPKRSCTEFWFSLKNGHFRSQPPVPCSEFSHEKIRKRDVNSMTRALTLFPDLWSITGMMGRDEGRMDLSFLKSMCKKLYGWGTYTFTYNLPRALAINEQPSIRRTC